MTDELPPERKGMLTNPVGKRSTSRGIAWVGAIGLFAVGMGETFMPDSGTASYPVIAGFLAMAIGPIGLNRAFGEKGLKEDHE